MIPIAQWPPATSERVLGASTIQWCQIAAVRASRRRATWAMTPGGGSPAVLLQTELALEGHPIEGSPSELAPMGCLDTRPDGDPWERSTVSREASQGTGVESSRGS
jgi:hypothetical protein